MANLANENASYIDHLLYSPSSVPNGQSDIEVVISPDFTSPQTTHIENVMDTVSAYISPDFNVTNDSGSADLTWMPNTLNSRPGYFDTRDVILLDTDGAGFENGIATHELGHALRLAHPGDTGGSSHDWNGSGTNWLDSDSGIVGPDATQGGLGDADTMMQWETNRSQSSDGNGGQDYLQWMDAQALQAAYGMETDNPAITINPVGSNLTVNLFGTGVGNENKIFDDAGSDNTEYVVSDGQRGFAGQLNGSDQVTFEGEIEEFVFTQDGTTLGIYDDDLSAFEFGVSSEAGAGGDGVTLNFDNGSYAVSSTGGTITVGGEEVGISGGSNDFGFEASDAIAI